MDERQWILFAKSEVKAIHYLKLQVLWHDVRCLLSLCIYLGYWQRWYQWMLEAVHELFPIRFPVHDEHKLEGFLHMISGICFVVNDSILPGKTGTANYKWNFQLLYHCRCSAEYINKQVVQKCFVLNKSLFHCSPISLNSLNWCSSSCISAQ